MGSPNKIGDIQPYAELHRGATTTVFKGFQKSLDRFVLLKILHPRYSRDEKIASRFEDEARLAAKIQHPNVVSIYSFGRENGQTYIAAEFVEGMTLAELIERGPLPPNIAAYVLIAASEALQAAHDKKILHRDIKPSNILVSNEGRVKVTDFGMASIASKGDKDALEVRGTLAYLAPEQILGKKPEPSSDLFSLGATFFEMLLGMPAFKAGSNNELIDKVLNFDPVSFLHDDDAIPAQLRRICQQLIKKKPEQRYQDCKVLLADLNAFRKSRGATSVATAGDMKSFIDDPEAYVRKLRDKPVTLRTREAKPRAEGTRAPREQKKAVSAKPSFSFNKPRVIGIAVAVLLVFGGLSFASDFFFSKDGSFGANNNPNGSAGPASSSSGAATTTRRSGNASGGSVVKSNSNGSSTSQPQQPPPTVEEAKAVTVIDKDPLEKLIAESDSLRAAGRPGDDLSDIDTVIVLADESRTTGKMVIDASPWAAVFLAGDSLGVTPLPIVVSPGTYQITLKNPEFPPFETLVDVVPGRETPFKVSLWSLVGNVQVEVFPFAEVSINGTYRDETPLNKPLIVKPGSHQITLKHPTLGTFEESFDVKAGENKTLKYNLTEMN